jgi:hypothetical protein
LQETTNIEKVIKSSNFFMVYHLIDVKTTKTK